VSSIVAESVSRDALRRHTRAIARWTRMTGSPDEAKAFEYIAEELERLGYSPNLYKSDAIVGYPLSASLSVVGAVQVSFRANGYSYSPSTPDGGVTAELVYVGSGMPEDYQSVDAAGRIVLSDGLATPVKALAAEREGAVGHIHINDDYIHEMCISPVWGTPTPDTAHLLPSVPAVGVLADDGLQLKQMLKQGPVTVCLETQTYFDWDRIPTLTADLPGMHEDRFVLFSGHVDSWHLGAMDNGTANATQLEVARILAERRDGLRRGVRLAFWSGHSHSRYAGSAWYADTFWNELHERCVCHVNVDSVGAVGATVLSEAPTMAETYGFARTVMQEVAQVALDYKRMGRFSDQSFWGHGVPSIFATFSQQPKSRDAAGDALRQLGGSGGRAGGLGWWWHTTEDTLDKVDPGNLLRDARVYSETVWRLCTESYLPFDYAAAATEIADALNHYNQIAGGKIEFTQIEAMARELGLAISNLDLSGFDAHDANDLIMDLGRLLIPINYTRLGPFDHDLALGSEPVPGLSGVHSLTQAAPDTSDFYYSKTALLRACNRVEHGLRSAIRRVEAFA
jgi:hypothetical protein